MKGQEFRKWAEHGVRQYGGDPWFLLRELAQNSRDAGASVIKVRALRDGELEVLEFEDDGSGMSMAHARRYLFTLYASSKDGDDRSAGKYGIGFWTVLRYAPTHVIVESRRGREGWAILIDENFRLSRIPCKLSHRGTRVTLARRAQEGTEADFRRSVRKGLRRYCSYLRRNDRASSKLPVLFHGENLTRSMKLPGMVSYSFRDGSVEGAVGLGDAPRVYLHARGLPVWKGAVLDELSHRARPDPGQSEIAAGLAPVFLLNGNHLNVIMSRKAVVDDRALHRVKKVARNAMARLVHLHVDRTVPRSLAGRVGDAVGDGWRALGRTRPAYLILALAVVVLAAVVAYRFPLFTGGGGRGDGATLPGTYMGALVTGPPGEGPIVDLTYQPPVDVWFGMVTAQTWDPARGFVVSEQDDRASGSGGVTCRDDCVQVRVKVERGGRVRLPVPVGHDVDPATLQLDGQPMDGLAHTLTGDAVVQIPRSGGVLTYATGPAPDRQVGDERALMATGPEPLPADVRQVIDRVRDRRVQARVMASVTLTRSLLAYDTSHQTAQTYRGLQSADSWTGFVLETGKGDCDVLNGLNAMLLRQMGVPARLVIGLVGKGGRAIGQLHAWTEYLDGGWQTVDATPPRHWPGTAMAVASAQAPAADPAEGIGTVPSPVTDTSSGEPAQPPAPAPWQAPAPSAPITESSPEGEPVLGGLDPVWVVAAGSLVLAGLLLVVLMLLGRRDYERMSGTESAEAGEKVLARILTSAALQPGMWRHAGELWSRRLLPTLDGRRISLVRARELSRAGKLFTGTERGELASGAAAAGSVVLDRSHGAFGSFIASLPGVIDLDEIEEHAPVFDETQDDALGRVLVWTNRVLRSPGREDIRVVRAPGLHGRDLRDVDLSGLKQGRSPSWPRRYVALAPEGELASELGSLATSNLPAAVYLLVQTVTTQSGFMTRRGDRIRARISEALVAEGAP